MSLRSSGSITIYEANECLVLLRNQATHKDTHKLLQDIMAFIAF